MSFSLDGSHLDSTINNPYEFVFVFMQDCEDELRAISQDELDDLKTMYEDFLELSTRYDDLKMDRDEMLRSLEENFLQVEELRQISGFANDETMSVWAEDPHRPNKVNNLFQALRGFYMDAITKPVETPVEPESPGMTPKLVKEINYLKEDNEKAQEEIAVLNEELTEAGDMIKVMDNNISELNTEVKRMKATLAGSSGDWKTKETDLEEEITQLCDEVTNYRRMAEDKTKELANYKDSVKNEKRKFSVESDAAQRDSQDLRSGMKELEQDNMELLQEIEHFKTMLKDSEKSENNKNLSIVSMKKEWRDERKKLEEQIEKLTLVQTQTLALTVPAHNNENELNVDGYENLMDSFNVEPEQAEGFLTEDNYTTDISKYRGDPKYDRENLTARLKTSQVQTKDKYKTADRKRREATFARGDEDADPDKIDYGNQTMMRKSFEAQKKKIKELTEELGGYKSQTIKLGEDVEYLQERMLKNQKEHLDIINELNIKLDDCNWVIAQLRITPGKKFVTKMGGLAETFKQSKMGLALFKPKEQREKEKEERKEEREEKKKEKEKKSRANSRRNV